MSDKIYEEHLTQITQLLSQPRTSFLIGAGCSHCAGLPMMDELTNNIFEDIEQKAKSNNEKKALNLLKDVRESFNTNQKVTIEDLLSEIQDIDSILTRRSNKGVKNPTYLINKTKYLLEDTQCLLKLIKNSIRDRLGSSIKTIKYHRIFCRAIHGQLVQGKERAKQPVNYFVLNYDTLIEDALSLESVTFNDGFVGGSTAWWDPNRFTGEEYTLGGDRKLDARVFKLHGSIDWIRPADSVYPIRIRNTLPVEEILDNGEPVVIYPSAFKYKEAQHDPFAQMITSFRKYITDTENHILAILGYGFGDEHINCEIEYGLINSDGALSVIIFWGSDELPAVVNKWINNGSISSQIKVFGKRGIWKDGERIFSSSKDLEWYKFEYISNLLGGNINDSEQEL